MSDPDDLDDDDELDISLTPPLAPQAKIPALRGLGDSSVDDQFNEEDFDDDFDDDFEEELEDDYPFELQLNTNDANVPEVDADLDVEIADLGDDDVAVDPADVEVEETEE